MAGLATIWKVKENPLALASGEAMSRLGDGVHIGGEHGIVDDGHILAYLRRRFLAELNVLLSGEEIKARLELGGTWGGRGGGQQQLATTADFVARRRRWASQR